MRKIVKLFKRGNVCVTGMRGSGKDVLFGNVIARRKKTYVSNLNYGGDFMPLDVSLLDLNNNYMNFIHNNINYYEFPYERGSDIYISDCGVYYPSQYCGELNKMYKNFPNFFALSRQVGPDVNIHCNAQALNRVWDKIREQSEIFIQCNFCKFIFKRLVIQSVYIYDKYQSAVDRVKPCRIKKPNIFMKKELRLQRELYLDNFFNTHGSIKKRILIYFNKSSHDSYYFGNLLKKGVVTH